MLDKVSVGSERGSRARRKWKPAQMENLGDCGRQQRVKLGREEGRSWELGVPELHRISHVEVVSADQCSAPSHLQETYVEISAISLDSFGFIFGYFVGHPSHKW